MTNETQNKLEIIAKGIFEQKKSWKIEEKEIADRSLALARQKTAYLLDLDNKYNLTFCSRDKNKLYFKTPSDCGRCAEGHAVMIGIFGGSFEMLPYVRYEGDRRYEVNLDSAKAFAESKGARK